MDNVELLLEECGGTLADICKCTIYLTDIRHREPVYRVLGERLRGVFPVFTGLVVGRSRGPSGSSRSGHRRDRGAAVTFSLAARCAASGRFGIAVTSSSPAVAARCAHARAGVGAAPRRTSPTRRSAPPSTSCSSAPTPSR